MAEAEQSLTVTPITTGRGPLCRRVLEALPHWFGIPSAVEEYVQAVESMPTFALMCDGEQVGLLAICETPGMAPELHVMGVLSQFHRRGGGKLLVEHACVHLRRRGATLFTVKTLSPARESAEYAATRRFYLALGFEPVIEIPNLWGPENPCLLMARRL